MTDAPEPVDIQVGTNIRGLRLLRKMTQMEVAKHLGITFQQLQKYEKGANRVSASKLHKMATIFGVRVEALFEGTEGTEQNAVAVLAPIDREALTLARDFEAIANPNVRHSIRGLVKSISRQQVADAA
ncbi:helix-turn-helix domain-containing protein [Rhizobium leguminosarum]|uniref:helix-turn-helix domain-containing protein n=2 Tax=Rhizobium TaxID=379 RepID=UPI0014423DA9|nr:helix-turn-helix transcriptional regulator [Rhizobium leguminosarum]MDH6273609.1 transcriptional regulator with XRE-family HTH domain [Rhizobium leguminosarum]NKK01040.1 helix-turn-helix domain-containing protein [Rhizobium leguminosarum bv. viciae]